MTAKSLVALAQKLKQKKYRRLENLFVIEGVKIISEALQSTVEIRAILVEDKRKDESKIAIICKKGQKKNIDIEYISPIEVKKISSSTTFSGVLALVEFVRQTDLNQASQTIICLDGISDPGNMGTILRTADWFGFKTIIISADSVDIYNPKTIQASMGSIFRLNIVVADDLVQTLLDLQADDYTVVGMVQDGQPLKALKKAVYVFGSESHGISPAISSIIDKKYTIKGSGKAESLNVAIAAGITMNYLA